jgi:dTDP-4-dehydrorhamnose 3,5-epimerase
MEIFKTTLEGVLRIQPRIFADDRGHFFESYSQRAFEQHGIHYNWVQDNQSLSQRGVLRGMHFQNPPFAQAKLVRVIRGAVLDVVVDIRKASPTYGQHEGFRLDGQNNTMLLIPEGFAHGFVTLEDDTVFLYKCSNFYNKASEDALLWNDPDLNINWQWDGPVHLSEKDQVAKPFKGFRSLF